MQHSVREILTGEGFVTYRAAPTERIMANELNLLSAGAVKPGISKVVEPFERDHRIRIRAMFATGPEIRARITAGEATDVVIAPAEVLSGQAAFEEPVSAGRIGVGIFVRRGVPAPKIATVEELREALLAAGGVVYNRASTGIYLEKLFDSLAISALIANKTVRYPDFAAVLDHVRRGTNREIGFGATTVIIENRDRGVVFAGPLPEQVQNYTEYVAANRTGSGDQARQFIRYLAGDAAKAALQAAGITVSPAEKTSP